jgi:DNA (cytosine-5)-methyltransferase 1
MLTPQHPLDLAPELVIDLFAGGGGASTGIEQALGYPPHIAINHDPEAVALHQANHPQTRHYVSDVFEVDPAAVTEGRAVGLLWASPDCKHFSKAKGGKPVSKKIRSLAWVVVKWAKAVRPRVICLENVEEFQTWGPLGADDRPCPLRKGRTFRRWKRSLERMGYAIEHRELRACDYGAPTIRKRLFLVARCDGAPIVWPAQTHAAPGSLQLRAHKGMQPWHTAAECIDWSIACPSIFERRKELAEATKRRIAKGVMRYVVLAKKPFIVRIGHTGHGDSGKVRSIDEPVSTITSKNEHLLVSPHIVPLTHQGGERVESIDAPFNTITGAHRGEKALAVSTLIGLGHGERPGQSPRVPGLDKPLGTITSQGRHHGLVSAFLAKHYGGVVGSALDASIGTITSVDHHSLVAANLVHMGHGEQSVDGAKRWSHGIRDVEQPLNTVTASGAAAGIVTSNLVKLRGTSDASATDEPLHTVSAGGLHHGEVRAFLVKYYGADQDPRLEEPLHTVTTKDRFGLVTVEGEPYAIVDIGLRMLTPRELFRAQGFPESYIIDRGADGRPLTKTAQVRMCGNSVCPPLARAIVAANYAEPQRLREAA